MKRWEEIIEGVTVRYREDPGRFVVANVIWPFETRDRQITVAAMSEMAYGATRARTWRPVRIDWMSVGDVDLVDAERFAKVMKVACKVGRQIARRCK